MDGAKWAKGSVEKGKAREVRGGIQDKEMDHLRPINRCEDISFYSEGSESHRIIWLQTGWGCGARAGSTRQEGSQVEVMMA